MISNFKFKRKISRLISSKKDFLASLVAIFLFLWLGNTYLKNVNPAIESVPNYYKLIKNPYESYERIADRKNIDKLIGNKQFIEMEYDEDLIKKEYPQKKIDPFLKSF